MFKKRNEGFTLVELLIVLAVIAALLAIVTPVAVRAVSRAKATQVASTLRNIAAAVQQYYYTEAEDATEVTVSTLKDKGYITGNVSNYEIVDSNGSSPVDFRNTTHFWVIYNGGGVNAEDVWKVWKDATDSAPVGDIGVEASVSKYW